MRFEAADPCEDVDMGPMKAWAPECLKVCPQMCGPLGHVHKAFSSKKLLGAEAELCEHMEEFACYYKHTAECSKMGAEAAKLGLRLPETKSGMDEKCSAALASEIRFEAADPCQDVDMGPMKAWAPECLKVCPQMCGPLGHVHKAFTSKKLRGAEAEVCKHMEEFACYYEHTAECTKLGAEAAKFGLRLPETKSGMDEQCTAALASEMRFEAADPCQGVDMGPMKAWAPECLKVCPQMCGPLGHVHKA